MKTAEEDRAMSLKLFVHSAILATVIIFLIKVAGYADELQQSRCLLGVPKVLQNAFVPPFNCSLCEHLDEVPWILSNETDQYSHLILRKEVPLVVRGAYRKIASEKTMSWDSLKEIYAGRTKKETCQFFPYKTEFRDLEDALQMSHERMQNHFYVGWSNCDPSISEILQKMYDVPDFLPKDSERSALEWFFVGNAGQGAHLHLDRLDKPSWQAQLGGSKRWTFVPLYECYFACRQLEIVTYPGDIILLDSSIWYHKTEVFGPELSIALGSEYD
ncbi:uncharacterized protein LOC100898298 [Galendromus occidentalis]|uniref:Uncharacterized protein LOC100898298 n=1 Tax=Galendromus occidentalis TaxID=34638 RepID=A0AAJ6QML5_9ACAR|nr:uncharacterized protein LOC100898298 [Galendromus occidentalis]